jgi:hypothetical protein
MFTEERIVPFFFAFGTFQGFKNMFFLILFVCAYNVWVISAPFPSPPPFHTALSLSPLPPLLPGRNYFALISNFVEERV